MGADVVKEFIEAIKEPPQDNTRAYSAIVSRIDDEGTVWVHLAGSEKETPTALVASEVERGDVVNVEWRNNRLYVANNVSNPAAGYFTTQGAVDFVAALEGQDVSVNSITAATGYIDDLYSKNITTENINATTGYIKDLKADNVTANDIKASTGYIGDLTSNNVTAQNIIADHATVGSLNANYAHITNGVIDNAKIGYADVNDLNAHYAQIDMANVNNAWIEDGVIKDAAISDAQIIGVSANKLTAGTIDASNINVTNLNADNITAGSITVDGITIDIENNESSIDGAYIEDGTITMNGFAQEVKDVIDGAIETYTGTVVPTLNNAPANAWTTTKLKDQHIGDVYYVVNASSEQNGYCYRFTKSGNTYSWQLIKDSDVTAALSRLTTAEGKITGLESFESTTSSWMTDTDEELSSLKTRTTTLEGDIDTVEGALATKVETSTFNELSQTVDENSASITSLSSVVDTKADNSTVTTLSNTVNTVSQTANSNSSKISNLTTVLGTNADGTTKEGDIVHRTSDVEQDLSGFKTTVSETYQTKSDMSGYSTTAQMNSAINQKAGEITSSVAETYQTKSDMSNYSTTTQMNSAINQKAGEITSSVSQTYATKTALADKADASDLDALEDKVDTAESTITQHATDISLKVSKNDVINQINVSTEGAQISASKVDIAGAAIFNNYSTTQQMNSAIGNAVDGIEVGGRNYAITSLGHIEIGTTETRQSGVTATLIGPATIKLNGTATSNDWFFSSSAVFCGIALEAGTYACWATTPNVSLRVGKGSDSAYFGSLTLGSKDNPYLFTIETSDIYWFTPNCAAGKSFSNQLVKIMIEKGNKATDWTPAPEDVQAEIDAKKSTHTLTASNTGGTTYATILGWAQEGTSVTFGVTSTAGVKIGDTVRIAYKAVDMGTGGTIVYILGTVTGVNNATSLTTISHGLDTTVIDGGHILTGTIDANKVNVSNLTVGSFGSEGLKTGGKNLLSGTLIMLNGEGTYASHTFRASGGTLSSTWFASADMPAPGLYRVLRTTNSTSSTAQCGFAQDRVPINIKSGTYVTISAWVRASVDNVTFKFQPFWYNNAYPCSNVGPATLTISRAWKHCTLTVKTTTNITPECSAGYCYATLPAGAFFDVTGLKLEVGSVATEFTDDTEFDGANLCAPGSDLEFNISNLVNIGFTAGGIAQGKRCSYLNGELGVSKYLCSSIDLIPQPNEFFTISCEMLLSNYTAGTTNPYVTLYFEGTSNNSSGSWKSAAVLITTVDGIQKHLANASEFPAQDLNGKGWVKVVSVGRYADVTFNTAFSLAAIYARDFTGKLCVRNFKVERGYKASPWTPNGDSRVATNYIYASSSGLRIASANPATQNQRIVLTSSQMSMYDSGNIERLRLNSSTGVLSGRPDKGHTVINDAGLDVYDKNNVLSGYFHGETARIGRGDRGRVDIASTGIDMYGYNANASSQNQNLCHIGFESGNAQSGQAYAPFYTFGIRSGNKGNYSLVEGESCEASGWCSHAEGYNTKAENANCHSEGFGCQANYVACHAEGYNTLAGEESGASTYDATAAHAEGNSTISSGIASHAEGWHTKAAGSYSHSGGCYTIANGSSQTVIGKYNVADTSSLFIVGNGTADNARSSIFKVDSSNITIKNGAGLRLNDGAGSEYSWNQIYSGTYSGTSNLYITADGYIGFYVGNTSTAPTGRTYVQYEGTSVTGWITAGSYIKASSYIEAGSNVRLPNNTSVQGKTTGNAYKALIFMDDSNRVHIGNSDSAVYVAGTSFTGNKPYSGSDLRLKHDIVQLDDRSEKLIMSLKPFEFEWNKDQELFCADGKCFGLGAQDVEDAMRDAGYDPEVYKITNKMSEGYLTLCYTDFIPHLIHVVQKQQKEIKMLTAEVKAIKEAC